MKAEIKGNKLLIELEIQNPPRPSSSGKTKIVATTSGNQVTAAVVNGQPVIVGVNAYIKN